ncbi:hypothetical protein BDU57DRAFT_443527 [Ampelomyces quisqualis]|uniref:Serine hydrolase domain-containing protein n=1 Tax=Ampelomyces quisqualis TaxID=50730 RepID=A0A6A5QTV0_AMPQU|nr:hypothetical protein BDU57DRAFT_443527 [Ampelomyces quisqualis]
MVTNETPTDITPGVHSSSAEPIKPTLLAFHGSGSNATVHTVQLARLNRLIKKDFHIESIQAPFPSPAGPGVLPFFDGCGPFFRWLPHATESLSHETMRNGSSTHLLPPQVEALVRAAVTRIRAAGSYVIGLVGFSQGTKVVAGLLRAAEMCREYGLRGEDVDWCDFAFGVSVCSSYPPGLVPGSVLDRVPALEREKAWERKISSPAFLVQGSRDEWNWAGKGLVGRHYEVGEGKGVLVEWDMGHHYPVQAEESERIAEWMKEVLKTVEAKRDVR